MLKIVGRIALVLFTTLAGAIAGTLSLINIFGNYFTDFQFFGSRGYEAGANIGFIVGGVLGLLAGVLLQRKIFASKPPQRQR